MMRDRGCQRGQALVEFLIVFPVYILFLTCFIQITQIVIAKFLVNYASHCTARAAIVSKADTSYMQDAAAVALCPLYGTTRGENEVLAAYYRARADVLAGKISVQLINNPSPVNAVNNAQSIHALSQDQKSLDVKVIYHYPMKIPMANRIIYMLVNSMQALGYRTTLSPSFLAGSGPGWGYPTIDLSSTCSMKMTTLTKPSR